MMYSFNKEILIENTVIAKDQPVYITAELSGNHKGDIDIARNIIDLAANAGVSAVKLQTYTADTMTIESSNKDFLIEDEDSLWSGRTLYDLYEEAMTPWSWHEPLFSLCREKNIHGFSSPFDVTAVDYLEDIGVPCYKIASFENNDLPLIDRIINTGKPIVMSTGMSTISELGHVVEYIHGKGCKDLILLKCTSSYPANNKQSNLLTIPHLEKLFGCLVGFSDHTLGLGASIASVALGAVFIEKHITLSRDNGAVDSEFSSEPAEFKTLVQEAEQARQSIGSVKYGSSDSAEKKSRAYRRSVYAVKDISIGDKFTSDNIRVIRPGFGLEPRYYNQVLGKIAAISHKKGDRITWESF